MQHKKSIKKIISFVLAAMLCSGIFSNIPMTAAAATRTVWLEVSSLTDTTADEQPGDIETWEHLEYVGGNRKCVHEEGDEDGKMIWEFSDEELGTNSKRKYNPLTATTYSNATVTWSFLTSHAKMRGSLKRHGANARLEKFGNFTNFIAGANGENIYDSRAAKAGKGYEAVSTVAAGLALDKGAGSRAAFQYICECGCAAYVYFDQYYSYCKYTDRFYNVGEEAVRMHCSANPDGSAGVPYVWPDDGSVTYGNCNDKKGSVEPYKHHIAKFNIVPNSYTIKYNGNGATSGTMADTPATYATGVTLRNNAFKRTGYSFQGWAKTKTRADAGTVDYADKASVKNLTEKNKGTFNLYAVWEENTGAFYYSANTGGTIPDSPYQNGDYYYQLGDTHIVQRSGSAKSGFENYKVTIKYSRATALDLANASSFGIKRTGYHVKPGAEWNTVRDGSGISFPHTGNVLEKMKSALSLTAATGQKVILYANWVPNTYTIKYNGNGAASGTMADTSASYDTVVTLRNNAFKRTGYSFQGWAKTKTRADAGIVDYADQAGVRNLTSTNGGTITLYAVWEKNTCRITWDANGGTSQYVQHLNWPTAKTLTGSSMTKLGDHTCYYTDYTDLKAYLMADRKYYVSAIANRTDTGADTLWVKNAADHAAKRESGSMAYALLQLRSCTDESFFKVLPVAGPDGDTFTVKESGYYYIRLGVYGKNASHRISSLKIGNMEEKESVHTCITYGNTYKAMPTPERTGYAFSGWYTAETGGTKIASTDTYKVTGDQTLYARWTANSYTLTVKPNGGTWGGKTTDQAFTIAYKGTKTIANPTRTGYTFAGWTRTGAGSSLSGTTFTMGSANATLTASWTINSYTLTVKPNGGTWNGKTTDQAFTLSYKGTKTIANPTRTGYTFAGWALSGAGSSLSGTTFTMGHANATLTARWTINSYTLTVKPNGGTWGGKTTDQAFTIAYKGTKTIANPIRTGYTFAGWTLSGAGSSLSGTTFTMGSANATLTARWTINSYTLTVKPNGGTWGGKTTDQAFTIVYKGTKTIADPTRTGYTFAGWTRTGAGSSLSGTMFTMGHANATLTARWTPDVPEENGQYTILFDGNGATEGEMSEVIAEAGKPVTLPENEYTRITEQGESLFLGWVRIPESHTPDYTDQQIIEEGLTQTADDTVILYAVWDDCPWLEVTDRYFNLWWAQNGRITEQELLRTVSATDREDVTLECRTSEELAVLGTEKSISLYDYDAGAFISMTGDGEVTVTYRAIDSAGHTVYKEAVIHVYDTSPLSPKEVSYTRYINRKYYEKSYEEGGLHPDSIWRKDPEYRSTLENALDNLENDTPKAVYYFSPEDVKEAKRYMEEHGFSDTKEPGALQGFYDRFMR